GQPFPGPPALLEGVLRIDRLEALHEGLRHGRLRVWPAWQEGCRDAKRDHRQDDGCLHRGDTRSTISCSIFSSLVHRSRSPLSRASSSATLLSSSIVLFSKLSTMRRASVRALLTSWTGFMSCGAIPPSGRVPGIWRVRCRAWLVRPSISTLRSAALLPAS